MRTLTQGHYGVRFKGVDCILILIMHSIFSEGISWGWKDLAVGVAVGTAAVAATPVVLSAAGFTAGGIAVGSAAASMQSVLYGSSVASGSIFAALQSAGVAGISTTASGIIAGTTGSAAVFIKKAGEKWFWNGKDKES